MPDARSLTSRLCAPRDACDVELTSFVSAGGSTTDGFVVGLALGAFIGYLVGPVIRWWLTRAEWAAASRETRLTDRLLERMEREADGDEESVAVDEKVGSTWRTHP